MSNKLNLFFTRKKTSENWKKIFTQLEFLDNSFVSKIMSFKFFFFLLLFSRVWIFPTLWTAACQASLTFTIFWSLLKLMSTESVIPSNHLIFCHPLLILPSIFPASKSFPVSWPFTSGGRSIGASASACVLPMNIQGWFPLGLTDLISLLQSRPTLCDPMDCSPPGSSVHVIL